MYLEENISMNQNEILKYLAIFFLLIFLHNNNTFYDKIFLEINFNDLCIIYIS